MNKKILLIGLIIIVVTMSIGYAIYSTSLKVTGTGNIDSNFNIEVTGIKEDKKEGKAISITEPTYTKTSATFNTKLSREKDNIEYKVEISNKGSIDGKIEKIEIINPNELIKVETRGIEKGQILKAGEKLEYIVIVCIPEGTKINEDVTSKIEVKVEIIQDDNQIFNEPEDGIEANKLSIESTMEESDYTSIKATVKAKGNGLRYSYSLDDKNYTEATESNTYTFTGLIPNKRYTVYYKVEDKDGNYVTNSKWIETKELIAPTIIVSSENNWANNKEVTITYPEIDGAKYYYKVEGKSETSLFSLEENWIETQDIITIITVNNNATVYAKVEKDGQFKDTKTDIDYIDSTAPELSINTASTSKSITVVANAIDNDSGIDNYQYSINDGEYIDHKKYNNYTFNELVHNTEYKIKVKVTDKMGNETEKEVTVKTKEIVTPRFVEETRGNVQIIFPEGCNNDYICSYIKDGGNEIKVTENPTITFTDGGTLIAKVTDGINYITSSTYTVRPPDNIAPTISNVVAGARIYNDPNFASGVNSAKVYNNSGNGTVVHSRVAMTTPSGSYALKITTNGTATPGLGGFYFGTQSAANEVFVTKIIAKIPTGYTINFASNATGTGGSARWLTSQAGTGDWKEYILEVTCGASGTFSTTNFYYINGVAATSSAPVTWYVAYATVYSNQDAGIRAGISMKAVDSESGIVGYGINQSSTTPPTYTNVTKTNQVVTIFENISKNGTYYLWVKDEAGNVATKSVSMARIDTTAPTCSWSGPAKSPIKNGTTTTYTLTCTDNLGQFSDNTIAVADIESSSTGAAYVSAVSAPTAVTNGYKWTVTVKAGATSHGTAQFRLKAGAISDVSGNKNALTAYSTALRNDSTGPTVKFGTNGSTTYSKTKSTTVSATDSYSAVSTIKYQWSQSTTAPTSFGGTIANGGTVNGSGVTGSNWYLWVQATDALGNVTTVKSNAFYFDNTAPTISASNNSGSNWTFNKVIISGTVSDGHSGINASSIEYSYDKSSTTYKDWDTATTSAYSGTWAAARNQPVYVRVCDKAGNWSAWVSAGYVRIFSALRGPVTTWGSLVGTANSKFQSGAHVKEVSKNASQSCFQWRCQAYVDRGNFNGTKVTTNWYIDFTMNGVGYYADSGWKNFATPCHNYGTAVTNTCNASYTGSSTYTATSSASITSYITS